MPPAPTGSTSRHAPTRAPSSPAASRSAKGLVKASSRSAASWAARRAATSARRAGSGAPVSSTQAASRKASRPAAGCSSASRRRSLRRAQRAASERAVSMRAPSGGGVEGVVEPGAGRHPAALGRPLGEPEGRGGLGEREAGEVAELAGPRLLGVEPFEPAERLVEPQHLIDADGREVADVGEGDGGGVAAAFGGALGPRVVHEDAAHDAGGEAEEVEAVLPRAPLLPRELEV